MADAKQGKSAMDEYRNGSSQSRVVLAKPKLGSGSSGLASNKHNPFGSVLRPPQLKPTSNPFFKVPENLDTELDKDKKEVENEEPANDERLKETKNETETPKFIPLGSTNVTPRTTNPVSAPAQPTSSSSSGFVFGQNLCERVVLSEQVNNGESPPVDHKSTNGTSELLFSSAVASANDNSQPQEEASSSEVSGESSSSLAAAAAEYERSHARPPPPTTNYTTTGEEGEINVLQISCRLFAWEAGSWRERGRGVLRLNDGRAGGARLVARVAGSLRVALNTNLWPAMVAQRAGARSLRVTAADANGLVKLFLIMGAPGDINELYEALTARISEGNKRVVDSAQNSSSQQAAERLEAAADKEELEPLADHSPEHTTEHQPQQQDDTENEQLDKEDQQTKDSQKDTKSLKRKEPAEDDSSPKRQCPKIVIE